MTHVAETEQILQTKSLHEPSIKEVLTNKAFMLLFSAQFIENVGRAISGLALEFLIFQLTKDPLLMGILSIIWLAPFMIIAPFAGVYTDRLDQRKIMLVSNIISCLASIGFLIVYLFREQLIICTGLQTIITNGVPTVVQTFSCIHVIWPLFLLCFLNSTAAAFFFPARNSYTRFIVQKKNLLVANSIGSTVFQIATIVGFVLAGVLAGISYFVSFIFDASTFFVSGILIAFIFLVGKKPPQKVKKQRTVKAEIKSVFQDMKIGYQTIRHYPKISYMLVIFSAITFTFGAINVLFIIILQGEMGLGPTWYGIFQSLMGISGIVTAVILMSIGKINRKILLLNVTFALATIDMFIFAVVRNPWVIAVSLFIFGILSVCINVPSSTLIQETIPFDKQGRAFGTQQLVQGMAQLIGMGIVSIVAKYIQSKYILLASSSFLAIMIIFAIIYAIRNNLMSSDYAETTTQEEAKEKVILEAEKDALDQLLSQDKQAAFGYGENEAANK
jgi:MFS family permease